MENVASDQKSVSCNLSARNAHGARALVQKMSSSGVTSPDTALERHGDYIYIYISRLPL